METGTRLPSREQSMITWNRQIFWCCMWGSTMYLPPKTPARKEREARADRVLSRFSWLPDWFDESRLAVGLSLWFRATPSGLKPSAGGRCALAGCQRESPNHHPCCQKEWHKSTAHDRVCAHCRTESIGLIRSNAEGHDRRNGSMDRCTGNVCRDVR